MLEADTMTNDQLIADICEGLTGRPDPLFVRKPRESGLSDGDVLIVCITINGICLECFDNYSPCTCWAREIEQ